MESGTLSLMQNKATCQKRPKEGLFKKIFHSLCHLLISIVITFLTILFLPAQEAEGVCQPRRAALQTTDKHCAHQTLPDCSCTRGKAIAFNAHLWPSSSSAT